MAQRRAVRATTVKTKLVAHTSPKQINIALQGSDVNKRPHTENDIDLIGIYRFEEVDGKRRLEYCLAPATEPRPENFSVAPGSHQIHVRLKEYNVKELNWAVKPQLQFGEVRKINLPDFWNLKPEGTGAESELGKVLNGEADRPGTKLTFEVKTFVTQGIGLDNIFEQSKFALLE